MISLELNLIAQITGIIIDGNIYGDASNATTHCNGALCWRRLKWPSSSARRLMTVVLGCSVVVFLLREFSRDVV